MSKKLLYRENPALYEINTAAWLFDISQKTGRKISLCEVPGGEWDRIQALGMDFVWLLGVWQRSQEGRKIALGDPVLQKSFLEVLPGCTGEDIIGSCFSIGDYQPDPLIGTWQDIDTARRELNSRGIGLILDFVPNHTGIDHPWTRQHPDYYVKVGKNEYLRSRDTCFPLKSGGNIIYLAHGRDPYFPPWTDTAQLNYFNPATRTAMIEWLKEISGHCDGVRCDMAMLVLNSIFQRDWGWTNQPGVYPEIAGEFWSEAIREVPGLVYIAEAYWDTEWTLQQLGFDFVYDKRLYDRIRNSPAYEIVLHLKADLSYQSKLVRFIENHDEIRSLAAFGKRKSEMAAVLVSSLPGMRFYHQGQFEGFKMKIPLQLRQTKPEAGDADIRAFYHTLLSTVNQPIFHNGSWRLKEVFKDIDDTFNNLIAYLWKLEDESGLIIVNLSRLPAQGRICFQDDISEQSEYKFYEVFGGNTFKASGLLMAHPGLSFAVDGYQGQIFKITSIG